MEKFIFLATIKDKLTEMNLPKEIVDKHVKVFEDCFKGKGASEVDKVINGAGGIDGILLSIYNLENAKQKDNNYICPVKNSSDITENIAKQQEDENADNTADNIAPSLKRVAAITANVANNGISTEAPGDEADDASAENDAEDNANKNDTIAIPVLNGTSSEDKVKEDSKESNAETVSDNETDISATEDTHGASESKTEEDAAENKTDTTDSPNEEPAQKIDLNEVFASADEKAAPPEEPTDAQEDDPPTIELPKSSEITEHIKEAEKITETLERIPIPTDKNEEEFPSELSDYDFDKLFEEKLSKPESWAKKLRSKMSPKVFWCTLPIPIVLFAVIFTVVLALIPILIASGIACAAAYIVVLVVGVCFSVIPIGYGIFMCFNSMPIAFYELGIGITSTGATMFGSIILYNYFKRLVPYLIKKVIKLFKLCFRVAKRYFKKPVKEVE